MFDDTDLLEPNRVGVALGFFWAALPNREWWTLDGLAWLVVDAVWH